MLNNAAWNIVVAEGLLRIIYVSTAKRHFDVPALAELLGIAQRNNAGCGISGVLTFHDGAFLQILEGPAAAVEAIFARIEADDRHHQLILVERTAIETRAFASWAMGWVEHANLLRTGFDLDALKPHVPSADMIRAMLLSFEQAVAA